MIGPLFLLTYLGNDDCLAFVFTVCLLQSFAFISSAIDVDSIYEYNVNNSCH